jgi:hypothetical protein
MPMRDEEILQQYLHFGYLPCQGSFLPLGMFNTFSKKDKYENLPEPELVSLGASALRKAFGASYAETGYDKHIVPLSGGLDSRAILACLIEHTDTSNITTIKFGLPGTFDFEIGQRVAQAAGVRCRTIDLSNVVWNQDELISCAGKTTHPLPLFESFLFFQMMELFDSSSIYWSGFMGDPLSGSHLLCPESKSWRQARIRFCERNRYARSINLDRAGFKPDEILPKEPWFSANVLTLDEQLDFNVRQQHYIKPLVLFDGNTCKTPFLHPDWVNFILCVSNKYRIGQYLYKKIVQKAYPDLFSLPTKTNFGLPLNAPRWQVFARKGRLKLQSTARKFLPHLLWRVSPMINYIDFDLALHRRRDLKTVVYENIQDLKKRKVVDWIDIDGIWRRHQERKANHADALLVLASLEIYLKVKDGG